jgi:hypothetical protein
MPMGSKRKRNDKVESTAGAVFGYIALAIIIAVFVLMVIGLGK